MMGIGPMIKLMVLESLLTPIMLSTRDSGKMIYNMAKG